MNIYACMVLLVCIFIKTASATCIAGTNTNCFFLDLNEQCQNVCGNDTSGLANALSSYSIPGLQLIKEVIKGECGCVTVLSATCDYMNPLLATDPFNTEALSYFLTACSAEGAKITDNILNNEPCIGCFTPALTAIPASAATPNIAPAPTPTPAPAPTSTLTPTPTPVPVLTPTSTSSSNNGGVSCIAHDQTVFEENKGKVNVSTLKVGDKIMTHKGFQDFIGYIHEGSFQRTLIITTDTESVVELTEDHLIKVQNNYVHAKHVVVGSHLSSGQVVKIMSGKSFVVSPLTRSGTILVNNVILSCYANVFSHNIANFALVPLRINIVKDINKYFSALIAFYNASPKWFRHIIALNDSYTF